MEDLKSYVGKRMAITTNKIAFIVLIVFSLLLSAVLFKAIYADNAENIWFRAFKDGFLLLGGAFTTLIGYYFGSRGGDLALKDAERIGKEAQKLVEEFDEMAPTSSEDAKDVKPINL